MHGQQHIKILVRGFRRFEKTHFLRKFGNC